MSVGKQEEEDESLSRKKSDLGSVYSQSKK
jgi:hypothetical protein